MTTALATEVDTWEHGLRITFLERWLYSGLENTAEPLIFIRHLLVAAIAYVSAGRFQCADIAPTIGKGEHLAGVPGLFPDHV